MAKLIGAVTWRRKKKKKKNTYSPQRQSDKRGFFPSFFWSTLPSAQCHGADPSSRNQSATKEKTNLLQKKKIKKWQIARGREKVLTKIMFGLFCSFYDVSVSSADIRRQSDMKHGKLSPNPIWNGWDKVPGKFRGTERAEGGRAAGGRNRKKKRGRRRERPWALTEGETFEHISSVRGTKVICRCKAVEVREGKGKKKHAFLLSHASLLTWILFPPHTQGQAE